MINVKVVVMHDGGPTHEKLVMIVHFREKHDGIMICENLNGLSIRSKGNLLSAWIRLEDGSIHPSS